RRPQGPLRGALRLLHGEQGGDLLRQGPPSCTAGLRCGYREEDRGEILPADPLRGGPLLRALPCGPALRPGAPDAGARTRAEPRPLRPRRLVLPRGESTGQRRPPPTG